MKEMKKIQLQLRMERKQPSSLKDASHTNQVM